MGWVAVLSLGLTNALFAIWLLARRVVRLTEDLACALADRDVARAAEAELCDELDAAHNVETLLLAALDAARRSTGRLEAVADAVHGTVNGRYVDQRVIRQASAADADVQSVSDEDWARIVQRIRRQGDER